MLFLILNPLLLYKPFIYYFQDKKKLCFISYKVKLLFSNKHVWLSTDDWFILGLECDVTFK